MLSTLFPPSLVPPRSNIKISGREKRKHALAYKRDFPLSRDPLESRERERKGWKDEGWNVLFASKAKQICKRERHLDLLRWLEIFENIRKGIIYSDVEISMRA